MSGFGSGGFGAGFGQNNSQQSSGFGFGSNSNNNASGFGSNTPSTFGSANTTLGGSLFGSGNNNTGGFGSSSGTFGSTTNNAFGGAKPAFGSTATSGGGGLFGSSNTNTGASSFGGFGNTSTTTNTSPFGGSGGLFGANKPAFGSAASNPSSSSLFGGNTSTGFGSSTTGAFGAANNPGIGGNVGDPPGTAVTPFNPYNEKEPNSTTNQSNSFQSILFQEPYKKWSADELRLADYAQGRKHGNASGAGAFGVSSGFGSGFGTNNNTQASTFGNTPSGGGLFGGSTNTSSGFGQAASSSFGGGTSGGGLFGSKPATTTGGLFGSAAQPNQASTGLFGSNTGGFGAGANTGSAFGSNNASSGGSLFGSAANTTQNKPTGGFSFGQTGASTGFGNTTTNNTFGTTNTANSGGGLFGGAGQTTGSSLFGASNQQQTTGSGFATGFGNQSQQTGSSLFGNNAQKPASGLFGTGSTTAGGLFGNQPSTSTGFGGAQAGGSTGGLFGSKPAAAGTGLFGSSTTGQNVGTGGGLFGGLGSGQQTQQPAQQSMFSSLGQNQQKPSLFASTQPTVGGLFGSQNTQQPSFFGSSVAQQQTQNSLLGSSILGNTQALNQTPQSLTTTIADVSAYGTPSLFSNLSSGEMQNPGPLATPLGNKNKPRRSSILPIHKLNPTSARFVTPQKRGFGFSYSTYGTPGSPSSVASTPGGLSRSLLGTGSLSRGLSKSVSTSSLRRSFNTEDSILAPGAFSASSGARFYGSNGSVKKLVINRDMRSDLFSTPSKDKQAIEPPNGSRKLSKRVSFDTSNVESPEDSREDISSPKKADSSDTRSSSSRSLNGAQSAIPPTSEDDQSKGKELAIVHEEDTPARSTQLGATDKVPGNYWMRPSRAEIDAMSRTQLQRVTNFTVGRENVGHVLFRQPVDLTNIKLEELFGGVVNLQTRAATVYPDPSKKPPVGKGLNVPARITLEQSWPRVRSDAKRLSKHLERLRRIENTTFEGYDETTGVWTFTVEHFTTYGLEYDDDETDADIPRVLAEEQPSVPRNGGQDVDVASLSASDDDTFAFKRRHMALPGSFGPELIADELRNDEFPESSRDGLRMHKDTSPQTRPATLRDDNDRDEGINGTDDILDLDYDSDSPLAKLSSDDARNSSASTEVPGGILRARTKALKERDINIGQAVAQQSIWREGIEKNLDKRVRQHQDDYSGMIDDALTSQLASDAQGFQTSMDLMNSIFGKDGEPASSSQAPVPPLGFVKLPLDQDDDVIHHDSLAGVVAGPVRPLGTVWEQNLRAFTMDNHFGETPASSTAALLLNHSQATEVSLMDGVPFAKLARVPLETLYHGQASNTPASLHEKQIWQLASILFDPVTVADGENMGSARKAKLSTFWQDIVSDATMSAISRAKTNEEKAVAALAGRKKIEACLNLQACRDFRLGTLVALIGSSEESKRSMRSQLKQWRDDNHLSEFSEPLRAIYELLAGNVCVSEGMKHGPVENRMDSFVISQRFGLDWRQSFGLRLWYGAAPDDDIDEAIHMFAADIEQDKEAEPSQLYGHSQAGLLPAGTEDLLWSLLKLYARRNTDSSAVISAPISQVSSTDFRLPWQLSQALRSIGSVSHVTEAARERMDALTASFASQLTHEGSWTKAAWVLLHISSPVSRSRVLRDHLARHWDMDAASAAELKTFNIPNLWIQEAAALRYRVEAERQGPNGRHTMKMLEMNLLWLDESTRDETFKIFDNDVGPSCVIRRMPQDLSRLSKWIGRNPNIDPCGGLLSRVAAAENGAAVGADGRRLAATAALAALRV